MDEKTVASLLRTFGISTAILGGVLVVVAGVVVYRNYLEITKTKLQIGLLRKGTQVG